MAGREAVEVLRNLGYELPILALTAHASDEEWSRCEASGFSGYLNKPVLRQNLIEGVRLALIAADRREEGKPEISPALKKIYLAFLERLSAEGPRLIDACKSSDWEVARQLAHQLKGTAACCGFDDIRTIMAEMESNIKSERNITVLSQHQTHLESARSSAVARLT